jgi:hypothetical protein
MKRPDTVNQKVHVKLGDVLQLISEWKVGQLRVGHLQEELTERDAGRMTGLTYALQTLGLVPEYSDVVNKAMEDQRPKVGGGQS